MTIAHMYKLFYRIFYDLEKKKKCIFKKILSSTFQENFVLVPLSLSVIIKTTQNSSKFKTVFFVVIFDILIGRCC